MLNNYGVFGQVNTVVQKFFTDRGVLFIEGSIPFLGRTPGNYALSRYDGHPNAAAHQIIAQHMAESLGSEIDLVSEMTKKSAMSH
jgi:hypothetical protein